MKINKILAILAISAAFSASPAVSAQDVAVSGASLNRDGRLMSVDMKLDVSSLKLKSNQAVVMTPVIVNGNDSLRLPSVGIYGRTEWYHLSRLRDFPITGKEEMALRYGKTGSEVDYAHVVDYKPWMNGSDLIVIKKFYGCEGCGDAAKSGQSGILASYRNEVFEPIFYYQEAVAEKVKTRELSGSAFIDFPVGKTLIDKNFRGNSRELAKITATIDSVRNDKDITVTALSIKGFASPEGSYAGNERLAKGRTEALEKYVRQLYSFGPGFIHTSYEAEDWSGLKAWVEKSNISNKEAILEIINDNSIEPDTKNSRIQARYPEQYKYLLENVYPTLRRSDYKIEYTIRGFSDVVEIAEVMETHPSKLSLNEMYLLAETKTPGSDEFNEIMDTAVRMYPTDEIANLNAANTAMRRGDLQTASRYLSRAGNSPEAIYARGIHAALSGDFGKGISLVEQAKKAGLKDTQGALEKMKEASKYAN